MLFELAPTSLDVRDRNIIEIRGARRKVTEHEPCIGRAYGKVRVHRPDRGPIETNLSMSCTRLVILYCDTVPGIGIHCIARTLYRVGTATRIPEVDSETMLT